MAGQIQQELRNSKPITSIEVEVFLNVQRTAERLTQLVNAALERVGFNHDEYNALRILRGTGTTGRTADDIRGRMVRYTGRILALLYAIKVRGLVDGAVTMTISQAGLHLLASADEQVEAAIRQRMAGIEEQKLRATVDIMEALRTGS
ncbi:MAG: hypothetical protein ACR2M1_14645 [Gemmatimonadaceae bacterium]